MAYCNPPKEHAFPRHRPYAPNAGHKGPYLLPLIKRFLEKRIKVKDLQIPEELKKDCRVKDALIWRLILNAVEKGENEAIKELLNRVDGKVADVVKEIKDDSALFNEEIDLIPSDGNGKLSRIQDYLKKQE